MVAIITGSGVGLERSSARLLGAQGQLGGASFGRAGENVFVNAATGNLMVTDTDESLIGRGPDLALDRTYNSMGAWDGDNGDNWRMGGYRRVTGLTGTLNTVGSTVTRTDWDGSAIVYSWDTGANAYVSTDGAGAYDRITFDSALNRWNWTDGDTAFYEVYDNANAGRIITRNYNGTVYQSFSYTGSLLTKIINNGGEYTLLVYGGSGGNQLQYLETHTNSPTTTTTRTYYDYDAAGRLSKVTVNLNPADNSKDASDYWISYGYDTSNRVNQITQTDGSSISFTYDASGRISTLIEAVATGVSRTTNFTYGSGTTTVTDALGQKTVLTYDGAGNLTGVTMPASGTNDPAPSLTFTWETDGDLASMTAAGNTVSYQYDTQGNRILERDSLGNTVTRTYGAKNELLTETRYTVPDPDGAGSGQPSGAVTTRYAYDSLKNLRFVVTSLGKVTEYTYDAYGNRTSEMDYGASLYTASGSTDEATLSNWASLIADKSGGQRIDTSYDVRGNISQTITYARLLATGAFDTSSERFRTVYVYSPSGELLSRQVEYQTPTEVYVYDGLHRIVSSTDITGATTTIAFSDNSSTTTVTLASGLVRTSTYDLAGDLLTYTESGTGTTTRTSTYKYDVLGRLRMAIDPVGNKTFYFYDGDGRRIAEVDADGSATEYRYDATGRVTSSTAWATKLSTGQLGDLATRLASALDASGKASSVSFASYRPAADPDGNDRWSWTFYDRAGRTIRSIDGTGAVTTYSYNGASQLTGTTRLANRMTGGDLAALMTASSGPANLLAGASDPAFWQASSATLTQNGSVGGNPALQLTANTTGQLGIAQSTTHMVSVQAGDTLTYSVQLTAGTSTAAALGLLGSSSLYGANADASVTITGPGMLTRAGGSAWQITGLNATDVTTVTITRTFTQTESAFARVYVDSPISGATAGHSILFAGASLTRPAGTISAALPASNSTNDRITRNFYDDDGNLVGSLDAEGYLTEFVYDNAGHKVSTVAWSGATAAGQRASGSLSDLRATITADNSKDIRHWYLYDARGKLAAEIDGEGNLTRYHYMAAGYLDQQITGQKLDPATLIATPPTLAGLPAAPAGTVLRTVSWTRNLAGDPLTQTVSLTGSSTTTTSYSYDAMRRLVSTTTQSGGTSPRSYLQRYDLLGRLIGELSGDGVAALTALGASPTAAQVDQVYSDYGTVYTYDAADRLIAKTAPNGAGKAPAKTFYYYNVDGQLVYAIDPLGHTVEYRYDNFGERTDIITYTVTVPTGAFTGGAVTALPATVTAALNADTAETAIHTDYNVDGTVRQTLDALGNASNYTYNAFDEVMTRTDPNGGGTTVQTSFAYDRRGLLKQQIVDSASGGKAITTSYGYDAFGRQFTLTDPNNNVTTTGYDRAGRRISVKDAAGAVTGNAWDARGNLVATTDALGHVTRYVYDKANRKIATISALGDVTTTSYDADGRVIATRSYANDIANAGGLPLEVTESSLALPAVNTAADSFTRYFYDAAGNLTGTIQPDGAVTETRYDAAGRVTSTTTYATRLTSTQLATLVDANGKPTSAAFLRPGSSNDDAWSWTIYDLDGRVAQTIDALGDVVQYRYDAMDRVIGKTAFTTRLDATQLSWLKTAPQGLAPNVVLNSQFADMTGWTIGYNPNNIVNAGSPYVSGYQNKNFVKIGFTATTSGQVASIATDLRAVPVTGGQTYAVQAGVEGSGAVGTQKLTVWWFDASGNNIGGTDIGTVSGAQSYDTKISGFATAPVGAVSARLELYMTTSGAGTGTFVVVQPEMSAASAGQTTMPAFTPTPASSTADDVTTYTYGKDGNLVAVKDALGNITRYVYDTAGRKIATIGALGDISTISYDSAGRVIATRSYINPVSNVASLPLEVTAASLVLPAINNTADSFSRNFYDAAGNLVGTVQGDGAATSYRYDVNGRVTSSTVYAKRINAATLFDSAGKPLDQTFSAIAPVRDDTNDVWSWTIYDVDGRVAQTVDSLGDVVQYRYDAMDRAIGKTAFATRLSSAELTWLKTAPQGLAPNVVPNSQFAGTTTWTIGAGDPAGIVKAGSPYTLTTGGKDAIKIDFVATAAGQVTSIATDLYAVPVTAGQHYAVQVGAEGQGPIGAQDLVVWWYDASGNNIGKSTIGSLSGPQSFDTKISGFADAPAGAVSARFELYMNTTGAGTGSFVVTRPIMSAASVGQITVPAFTPTPAKSAGDDVTTYTYGKDGNLVAVKDALGNITRYVYDSLGRKIATIDASRAVSFIAYDADGNVIATRDYYTALRAQDVPATTLEVSAATLQSWLANANVAATSTSDHLTRYAYDPAGQLRYTMDALGHVVETVYDATGNAIRTIAYDGKVTAVPGDGNYSTTWFAGQVASLANAAGTRVTRSVYDAVGQLAYAIDATGQITSLVHDSEGHLIQRTEYAATGARYTPTDDPSIATVAGWLSGKTSTDDRTTYAWYDGDGRQVYAQDALGYVTRNEYDQLGHVVKQTRYAGVYSYTSATALTTLNTAFTTPPSDARATQFTYDAAGRLVSTTDPDGYVTKLVLNALGQITSSTVAFGATDGTAPSTTSYTYDALGRVLSQTRDVATSPAATVTTSFTWDALGRMTDRVEASGTGDAATTHWTYDVLGRVLSETSGYGTSLAAQVQYGYDAFGRLATTTDARGSVTSSIYDALDELQSSTAQMEAGTADDVTTRYTYDNFGNVVKTVDPRGNASFAYYDKLDRVTRQVDAGNYVTDTTYTRGGKVETVKRWANPLGGTVVETTNPGAPQADTDHDAVTTFRYNKRDELTGVLDAVQADKATADQKWESYTLDAFGERTQVTNKLGGTTTYTYNKRGQVLSETLPVNTKTSSGTVIAVKNSYVYDGRGNRTKMIQADGAAEARTTNYTYDLLDRLIRTTGDTVTVTANDLSTSSVALTQNVTYDRRGNAIESVDPAGARTLAWYDVLDRKTDELSPVGTLTHYTYDANGNVVSVKVYGVAISPLPAAGGTPPSPVAGDTPRETTFHYDRLNRQDSSSIAGVTTGEYNSATAAYTITTGTISTGTVYDMAGNIISQVDARGGVTSTWYDKLGRKVAQVDAENYLTVWTRDAEGNALSETRYAKKITGTFGSTSTVAQLQALVDNSANNRITLFTYDKNGNRLSEERQSVQIGTLDANGALQALSTVASKIQYSYDGLGNILSKIEANGDTSTYTYDLAGRLTQETGQGFTDYKNHLVTPTTKYAYDGLNNLISTTVLDDHVVSSNDRVTTYVYDKAGRLTAMTTADGSADAFRHDYGYDAAGRQMWDIYVRKDSNGAPLATEAQITRYDAAGRVILQGSARLDSGVWNFGFAATRIAYDAFGEVIGRGMTGGANDTLATYQETFSYDQAGRLWRTYGANGAAYYLYDRQGNQTLALTSTSSSTTAAADLSSKSAADITGSIQANGDTNIAGAVTTLSSYDKRNQLVATAQPRREITTSTSNNAVVASTITTARAYNAFGEVLSETDGRGNVTTYAYNTMGRMVQKQLPQVSYTNAQGGVINGATPTELYAYDVSGRRIAVTDANGYTTTRELLAGTGHGDDDALATREIHPDGGKPVTMYDIFGDARVLRNELYDPAHGVDTDKSDELRTYDRLGQLVMVDHRGRAPAGGSEPASHAIDYYGYDGLGQRIWHYGNQYGSAQKDRTDYDIQGRVISQVAIGGDTTTYTYTWNANATTSILGVKGAWTKVTTTAIELTAGGAHRTSTDVTDYFGREIDKIDLGGHDYSFTYNLAGQLTARTNNAGENLTYSYYNTGLLAATGANYSAGSYGTSTTGSYRYDANGNRTWQSDISNAALTLFNGATSYRTDATITYDALDRMTSYVGAATGINVSINYEYDLAGNIRHMVSTYPAIGQEGNLDYGMTTQDYWYRYDSMNRFVVTKGTLVGSRGTGQISRGATGLDIDYDLAGQRIKVTQTKETTASGVYHVNMKGDTSYWWYTTEQPDDDGTYVYYFSNPTYNAASSEYYTYTPDGLLATVSSGTEGFIVSGQSVVGDGDTYNAGAIASYTRDHMGRVTLYNEYQAAGSPTVVYSRASSFNIKSQVTDDTVTTLRSGDTWITSTHYDFTNEAVYNSGVWTNGAYLGTVTHQRATTTKTSGGVTTNQPTTDSETEYAWWDSASVSMTSYDTDTSTGSDGQQVSTYFYDPSGNLQWVNIADGRPRRVLFANDTDGHVLSRDEQDQYANNGDPRSVHFYLNGVAVGDISNNGTSNVDYAASIAKHLAPPNDHTSNAFRDGVGWVPSLNYADFDQSYDAINGLTYDNAPTSYTVQGGETLQTIAQTAWGDASLWYMIADANGLTGSETLVSGRSLILPNKVHNSHNSADTFRPYDPNEAMGDTSPTVPKKAKNKCGVFGQILLVAIAVAVTFITYGALAAPAQTLALSGMTIGSTVVPGAVATVAGTSGLSLVAAGAVAGIAGSLASQAVGLVTGIQQGGFDWKGVAVAGLTGGITAGIGANGLFGQSGLFGSVSSNVVRTGLNGLVANGLTQSIGKLTGLQKQFSWAGVAAAGVGSAVSGSFRVKGLPTILNNGVTGMAGGIANAASRSLITGTDFGDNLMAALPDIIGTTVGRALTDLMQVEHARAEQAKADKAAQNANSQPVQNVGTIGQAGNTSSFSLGPLVAIGDQIDLSMGGSAYLTQIVRANMRADEQMALNSNVDARAAESPTQPTIADSNDIVVTATKAAYEANRSLKGTADISDMKIGGSDYIGWMKGHATNDVPTFWKSNNFNYANGKPNVAAHVAWAQRTVQQAMREGRFYDIEREILPAAQRWAQNDEGFQAQAKVFQDYVDQRNALFNQEMGTIAKTGAVIGLTAMAAYATGGLAVAAYSSLGSGSLLLAGSAGVGALTSLDYTQSGVRGILSGSYEFQPTVGGSLLNQIPGVNGYGEQIYAVANLAHGLTQLPGVVRSLAGPASERAFGATLETANPFSQTVGTVEGTINLTLGDAGPLPPITPSYVRPAGPATNGSFDLGLNGSDLTLNAPTLAAETTTALPDAFAGVKDASAYLKSMGVDRATRVQILQSFETGTISVETAGDSLYGIRFHDFGEKARPMGQYLFETFTSQTNRAGLALPPEWNGMTGIKQWQITPGTTVLRGGTAPQLSYGSQYVGGAKQMFVLEPWKYGSLK